MAIRSNNSAPPPSGDSARLASEAAVLASEARHRTLFNSIDEGFYIVEVIFDNSGKAVDYKFVEINSSFAKQTGLEDAVGKRMRELKPLHEEHWFEIYGRVALTGEPVRFQARAFQLHRLYDVFAFRMNEPQGHLVAILFNDITERKRVEEALRIREQRTHWQNEALLAAVNGAPLGESLSLLSRIVTEETGGEVRTAFYLSNAAGTTLHPVAGAGTMPDTYTKQVDGFLIGEDSLACGLAVPTGKPVLTADVFADPLWKPWTHLAEHFGFRGCWSFPINIADTKPFGTFAIYFRGPREATPADLALADIVTHAAAIIISHYRESNERAQAQEALRASEGQLRSLNEKLEERVRDRTAELEAEVHERRAAEERIKNLLRQLVSADEQQRRRIARELHDTFGQQLAALHMNIEVLRSKVAGDAEVLGNIERMREVFDRLNSSVDFLAWELRPPSLDLLGLDAALESYVKEWSQQFGVEAVYEGVAVAGLRLAGDAETNLYRIFQEALQNVHKHASADRVNVVFERLDGQAVLIIEDNGKGYDSEAPDHERSMGFINMRERAALIGGSLEVESQAGEGTTVFVRVPVGEVPQ